MFLGLFSDLQLRELRVRRVFSGPWYFSVKMVFYIGSTIYSFHVIIIPSASAARAQRSRNHSHTLSDISVFWAQGGTWPSRLPLERVDCSSFRKNYGFLLTLPPHTSPLEAGVWLACLLQSFSLPQKHRDSRAEATPTWLLSQVIWRAKRRGFTQ